MLHLEKHFWCAHSCWSMEHNWAMNRPYALPSVHLACSWCESCESESCLRYIIATETLSHLSTFFVSLSNCIGWKTTQPDRLFVFYSCLLLLQLQILELFSSSCKTTFAYHMISVCSSSLLGISSQRTIISQLAAWFITQHVYRWHTNFVMKQMCSFIGCESLWHH